MMPNLFESIALENEMRKRRNEALCRRIVYRIVQNAIKRGSWCAKAY